MQCHPGLLNDSGGDVLLAQVLFILHVIYKGVVATREIYINKIMELKTRQLFACSLHLPQVTDIYSNEDFACSNTTLSSW